MTSGAGSSRRRRTSAARASSPTHPELLDWLAARFIDCGWDVKALHRLDRHVGHLPAIVLGARRRCCCGWTRRTACSRAVRSTRLPAEQIRDSALAASGLLVRDGRRPERQAVPAGGLVGRSGTGQARTRRTRARSSIAAASTRSGSAPRRRRDAHVRRRVAAKSAPRGASHGDAAAGAGAAERPAVRRGGSRPRASGC